MGVAGREGDDQQAQGTGRPGPAATLVGAEQRLVQDHRPAATQLVDALPGLGRVLQGEQEPPVAAAEQRVPGTFQSSRPWPRRPGPAGARPRAAACGSSRQRPGGARPGRPGHGGGTGTRPPDPRRSRRAGPARPAPPRPGTGRRPAPGPGQQVAGGHLHLGPAHRPPHPRRPSPTPTASSSSRPTQSPGSPGLVPDSWNPCWGRPDGHVGLAQAPGG